MGGPWKAEYNTRRKKRKEKWSPAQTQADRKRDRDRMRRTRANKTPEQKAADLKRRQEREAERKAEMTPEEIAAEKAEAARKNKVYRARPGIKERYTYNKEKVRSKLTMAMRRSKMSEEQVKAQKAKINKAAREAYAANPEKFRETQKRRQMRKRLAVSGACTTNRSTQTSTLDLNALGAKLSREWPTSLDFQRVIDRCNKIRAGKEDESSLLVLDIEFFSHARKVFEVGLMQFNSGKTLINERVNHNCTLEELLLPSDGRLLKRGSRCIGMGSIQKFMAETQITVLEQRPLRKLLRYLSGLRLRRIQLYLSGILRPWIWNCLGSFWTQQDTQTSCRERQTVSH